MKLIKLQLENFRQFYGKVEMEFSTDLNKGVTLIHGENNGGKTTLLNAISWCLYEQLTDNLLERNSLINKHALEQNKNHFSVFLQLAHNNKLFEIRRIKTISNNTTNLKVFEIIDGHHTEVTTQSPQMLINTFLPVEMSKYFIYQGEGDGAKNSQTNFNDIKDAISKVLGLTVAEKTIAHLKQVRSGWLNDFKQFDTEDSIHAKNDEKDNLIKAIEINEDRKAKAETAYAEEFNKLSILMREFEKFDKTTIEDSIKKRTKIQSDNQVLTNKLEKLKQTKIKKSKDWALSAYSSKLGTFDLSIIDTNELNEKLTYSIDKQLLDEIILHQKCICGTSVENGSAASLLIEKLKKSAIDPDLKRRWNKARNLHVLISKSINPKQEILDLISEIDDCTDTINFNNSVVEELTVYITNSNIDDIKTIEECKKKIELDIKKYTAIIHESESNILTFKKDINTIDNQINSLLSSMPRAKNLRDKLNAIDRVIAIYEEAISDSQENVDKIILQKMKALFSKVALNGETVIQDKRESGSLGKFTWAIVDRKNKIIATGNGYQAMLAISFIVALIQFSQDRVNSNQHLLTPGTIAPFIADSFLSVIDPNNGKELLRYIANSIQQAIFMLSQAQWTKHTDEGVRDKIGKEYILVQHSVMKEEEFTGSFPLKLNVNGKDYDVVKFGSEFERVTIVEIPCNE